MNGAQETHLAADELEGACRVLTGSGGRMQMAYAWFPRPNQPAELLYLAAPAAMQPFHLWRCTPKPGEPVPSAAGICPLLGWYEREMTDLCGVRFDRQPEPHPLVLHEGATWSIAPLAAEDVRDVQLRFRRQPWELPEVQGNNVQLLSFGPVRADVFESAQFVFFYVGEAILHYFPRLFFKHRGMERRFQGLTPTLGVILAERVSGVGSVAHALAYCQAVEAAAECEVPARAQWLRCLLAEMERLYNHLHYLGHLCHTTTLKVGEAEGKLLEERAKQLNCVISGSRFLRNLLIPGGLRGELNLSALSETLETLREEFVAYADRLVRTNSHLDRLISTGRLERQVAFDEGATGPIERASGLDRDLRRDHPYAAYAELPLEVPCLDSGDAFARMRIRIAEVKASIALVQRVLLLLPAGPIRVECVPSPGAEGLGWAESPRGTLYYAVHVGRDAKLARVKIKSPSFSNWRVFPFTVHDSNMMDYAINEASFGLTMAGCDR